MLRALALSIGQLGDRPVRVVLFKSFAVTLAVFAGLGIALWALARRAAIWSGLAKDWQQLAGIVAILLVVGGAWLLFRAVAIAVVGIFADDVVEAVERRHYPEALHSAQPVSLARGAAMGLESAGRAILLNIAMLPVYAALLITGIGTAAAFFVVNGWLLGRDLGDMAAARHIERSALPAWRSGTRGRRFILGLAVTGLLLVPFVNLLAPVLGAAMATHLFHRKRPT